MVNQGRVPYHEHDDRDIRAALAQALNERKVRFTDKRLLILYGMFVALLLGLGAVVQVTNADRNRFERSVIANCNANQNNTRNFNAFIEKLLVTYRTSPVLTPEQKRDRLAFFGDAKQTVPECPITEG